VSSRDEQDALTRFRERYAVPTADVSAEIERRVIGAAWGANGYTTVEQADELGRRLELGAGRTVLDVGTGRGWPGLYLAAKTGCNLLGTDMPLEALAVAAHRARAESIDDRVMLIAASGANQPFRPNSVDAIVHTDVLC
jgi:methylase of polypeptide subunit release factors